MRIPNQGLGGGESGQRLKKIVTSPILMAEVVRVAKGTSDDFPGVHNVFDSESL